MGLAHECLQFVLNHFAKMADRQTFVSQGQVHAKEGIEHDNQACRTNKKEDFVAAKNAYVQAFNCFNSTLQFRLSDQEKKAIQSKLHDYVNRAEFMEKCAEQQDDQSESALGHSSQRKSNIDNETNRENEGAPSTQDDAQQSTAKSVLLRQGHTHIENAREHEERASSEDDTQRYVLAKDEYLNAAKCLIAAKNLELIPRVKTFLQEEAAKHVDRAEFVVKWLKAYGMYKVSGDTSVIIKEGDTNSELALQKDHHACMGNQAKPYGEAKELYSRASHCYRTALRYVTDGQVRSSVSNKNGSCLQRVSFMDERLRTLAGSNSTDISELFFR